MWGLHSRTEKDPEKAEFARIGQYFPVFDSV
jgi:hypothetical protein